MFLNFNNATTIAPFENLGEMAKLSEAVVLVEVKRNYTYELGSTTRFRSSLEIKQNIKGNLDVGEIFELQNLHKQVGDMESMIWGDLELKEGKTYLLFITRIGDNLWTSQMLSYAAFEEFEKNGEKLLVPFELGTEVHIHTTEGRKTPEPLGVFSTSKLTKMLKDVVDQKSSWNKATAITTYAPTQFSAGMRGTPPGHCSFLSGTPYARWPDFDTQSLPVRYAVGGDSGCATAGTKVANAIGSINGSYAGVDLSASGTHSFIPSCTGGEGATDGEFTSWVSTNLGGTRHLLVQFDDPCNEITDLSGCSGTLAIGGLYWFNSTHMAEGMTWRNAAYGYVVVNNGTGACQCSTTDYDIMMTHELSHSLNIGHIPAASGDANMNPSCCESIGALDIQCLDFIYTPMAVPVEVINFEGEVIENEVALNWTSLTELDNDYYTIEKVNTSGAYKILGEIAGQGNSSRQNDYRFVDINPHAGINYYRLAQTDFNRTKNIVETIAIEYSKPLTINLSPNPLNGEVLTVELGTAKNGKINIELYDLQGQQIEYLVKDVQKGQNIISLELSNLAAGIYFLKTSQNGNNETIRFIKN